MIPIVLAGVWLLCVAGAVLVGCSAVPANQYHGTAWVLAGLCTCMHLAFGAVPVVLDTPAQDVKTVLFFGTSALGGLLAYAFFRGCLKAGTLIKTTSLRA